MSTQNTPLFMGMCIYLEVKLIITVFRFIAWTHRSTQAETPVSCSCEQKLIGPEMTQAFLDWIT